MRHSLLYIFFDGVGLGPDSDDNPFASADTPTLHALIDRALIAGPEVLRDGLLFRGIDATLGVEGLPQSGSGQTALFTGINAAQAVGMHIASYPTRPLREIIAQHSVFKRAAQADKRVTFANPFSKDYWQAVEAGQMRLSATTLSIRAAGVDFRDVAHLERGEAVFWDITHDVSQNMRFRARRNATTNRSPRPRYPYKLPVIPAEEAGRRLAALGAQHDLTLYESFLTDLAGHRRLSIEPEEAIHTVDTFLGGVLQHRAAHTTLVLSSDHGNLETRTFKGHTLNPVPLLVIGPAVDHFRDVYAITDIAAALLRALDVQP